MKIVTSIADARAALRSLRQTPSLLNTSQFAPSREPTLGLIPTMGALHEGHLSLVRAAKRTCTHVAVSIFVNPIQFAPHEDLNRYPRTLDADIRLLETEGVDLLFAPTPLDIYPNGNPSIAVDPGPLGDRLDGRSRPGHFRGVTTIVSKLFNILQPDKAFFGQKDAAQVAVLRAMIRDLNFPVEIVVCPTIRDADGLALSSRNRFLTPEQRRSALAIPGALACAGRAIKGGERNTDALLQRLHHHLDVPDLRIDYVEAVHADTLLPQAEIDRNTLVAVAAYVGETRLIDNLSVGDLLQDRDLLRDRDLLPEVPAA